MKNKINNQSGIVFIHLVISILILAILITGFVLFVKGGKVKAHNAKIDSIIGQYEIDPASRPTWSGTSAYIFADGSKYVGEFKDGKLIKSKEELMKKYDAYQSIDIEMKMRGAPSGFDYSCYNECKERNSESFCRQKCSMQLQ